MPKLRWFGFLVIVLSVVAFSACDPIDDGYEYYSLNGSGAVQSCRVYYPSSLENNSQTYPAVTLSGGMTNSKYRRQRQFTQKPAGDWIDFIMNGDTGKKRSFTNPPNEVVLNWNNL